MTTKPTKHWQTNIEPTIVWETEFFLLKQKIRSRQIQTQNLGVFVTSRPSVPENQSN